MKSILLPFRNEDAAEKGFETAFLVAKKFAGHIEGLLVLESPNLFMRDFGGRFIAMNPTLVSDFAKEWRQVADKAHDRFAGIVTGHGMPLDTAPEGLEGPSADWREIEGRESEVVAEYGRLFDLIVIPRYVSTEPGAGEATIEAALFETGRPVIVAPSATKRTIGDIVVIAWNRSTETARTVALGMPLLQSARKVIVMSVDGWVFPGPDGEGLARHLGSAGINAVTETVKPNGRSNGQTILEEAAARDADLLIKGAYTHTRFRQLVFGGATREVLSQAELPVLMAH